MPLKVFNRADVESVSNQKPSARRLSKPRSISNSSRSPQKDNDRSPSARNSWIMEDEAVVEASSGSHRSRPSTRDRLRSQLFSERFAESNLSQTQKEDEHAEDNKRQSWLEVSSNRLSLPSREPTASPRLSSPGDSKLSLSLDTEIDVPKAVAMLQELKKTASPEDLVLLHKALLPAKDENSPASVNSEELWSLLAPPVDRTIRRRSMQQAPGVATRLSPRPSPMVSPSEESVMSQPLATPFQKYKEARSLSFPPRMPSHGQSLSTDSIAAMPQGGQANDNRAPTPSSQTDFGSLSTPGELRVTNGAASPDSMRSARKVQLVLRADLKAQQKETPVPHRREGPFPISSSQQTVPQGGNALGRLQTSDSRVRLPRDEGYFTASEHTSSSKEGTPYNEDEGKMLSHARQMSADLSSLPSQAKLSGGSPNTPRAKSRASHRRTRSESPDPTEIGNNAREDSRQADQMPDEDGKALMPIGSFWLGSPDVEDYKREIKSNPYTLSDDSQTSTPRASPPQDKAERSGAIEGHKRQQSRTPEEALRQLDGSHDGQAEREIYFLRGENECSSDSKRAPIRTYLGRQSEERSRRIEASRRTEEEPRNSENSFEKDSDYNAEASSARQSKQSIYSKHSNPGAPRPIEGGTFGKPSPTTNLVPDFGFLDGHLPSSQSSNSDNAAVHDSKGYEVSITSVQQIAPPKSKSSLKLRPSTWFSRSSSTPNINEPSNASLESLTPPLESPQPSRKPKKLQKSRPKSTVFRAPPEEDADGRPASKGNKDVGLGNESITKNFSRPVVSFNAPEDELAERVRQFAERNDSHEAISQDSQTTFDNQLPSFSVRSRKSSDARLKKAHENTSASNEAILSKAKTSRRNSIFGRGKSPARRSIEYDTSDRSFSQKLSFERQEEREGSESDTEGVDPGFGIVAESLGGSPYDVAMSGRHVRKAAWNSRPTAGHPSFPSHSHQAQQLMGQAMQPAGVPHPHQISNAHVRRPKSLFSMNEEQASEYARLRSRDRAEMLGKPRPFDLRDLPVSSGPAKPKSSIASLMSRTRPQSLYKTYPGAPPVPALPHMATLENDSPAEERDETTTSKVKAVERKSSDARLTTARRFSDEDVLLRSSLMEETKQSERSRSETRQKVRRDRRKASIRDRGREQPQPPSPIREEDGSPKSESGKSQTGSEKDARQKSLSEKILGTTGGNSGSSPLLQAATARKSNEGAAARKSPTQALEARLNSPPSQAMKYYASFEEEKDAELSKEAEHGLNVYPEFAHLLKARASAKGKAPERMLEYQSSNTTIDAVIASSTPVSVSPAARVAHSMLIPLNTSNSPLQEQNDETMPMPRRHIHPSARPRRASNPATSFASQSPQPEIPSLQLPADSASADTTPPRPKTSTGQTRQTQTRARPETADYAYSRPRSTGSRPTSTDLLSPTASEHVELLHRYSGGLNYGWERGVGIGGSAGTREEGNRASWKGVHDRMSWGVDLGDIPVFVTGR